MKGILRYAQDAVQNARNDVREALREDIGSGDITTQAIVPRAQTASAKIVAKQDLVLAGLAAAKEIFQRLDRKIKWKALKKEGDFVRKGTVLATIAGRAAAILTAERTALNFLQHLCGIATLTRQYVKALAKTKTKIYDTRKTTPGWRLLEKYAVRLGGGVNHRLGLYDRYLIKNNHVDQAGGIARAIEKVLRHRRRQSKKAAVEVEVRNLKELKEALQFPIDLVLLDNFSPAQIRRALKLHRTLKPQRRGVIFEASGGMNLKNIRRYAQPGIDFISVGKLTHSAPAVDIHLIFFT